MTTTTTTATTAVPTAALAIDNATPCHPTAANSGSYTSPSNAETNLQLIRKKGFVAKNSIFTPPKTSCSPIIGAESVVEGPSSYVALPTTTASSSSSLSITGLSLESRKRSLVTDAMEEGPLNLSVKKSHRISPSLTSRLTFSDQPQISLFSNRSVESTSSSPGLGSNDSLMSGLLSAPSPQPLSVVNQSSTFPSSKPITQCRTSLCPTSEPSRQVFPQTFIFPYPAQSLSSRFMPILQPTTANTVITPTPFFNFALQERASIPPPPIFLNKFLHPSPPHKPQIFYHRIKCFLCGS